LLFVAIGLLTGVAAYGQIALPRESQRQEIVQTIGDTKLSIIYHRPNVKGRKIWDGLVPYGQVWRAGANEATLFETSRDVTVNGQPLPAGKYSFHIIPAADEWTLIFNKEDGQWGSFSYNEKADALRVTSKVQKAGFREALTYSFVDPKPNEVDVVLEWENVAVPFKVNIGDIHGRILGQIRDAANSKSEMQEKIPFLNQFAGYVATFGLKEHIPEATILIDGTLTARETYANLSLKARLLALEGKYRNAIETGEKAISVGRSSTPPANPNAVANFESQVKEWKAKLESSK
jgi:hypothetical protein